MCLLFTNDIKGYPQILWITLWILCVKQTLGRMVVTVLLNCTKSGLSFNSLFFNMLCYFCKRKCCLCAILLNLKCASVSYI